MEKKSFRIQMHPETKKFLEGLAKEHNCLYGEEPSISSLLAEIASKRLVIVNAISSSRKVLDDSLFLLRVEVHTGLRGTIAKITQTIGACGGNIAEIKLEVKSNYGYLHILLSLTKECNPVDLITSLKKLTIQDLANFNTDDDLILVVASHLDKRPQRLEDKILERIKQEPLVINLACMLGLKITIDNIKGTLGKITTRIAEEGILVSSAEQEFTDIEDEAIVKLFLYIEQSSQQVVSQQIEKIPKLLNRLRKIPEVRSVERLGIYSINYSI